MHLPLFELFARAGISAWPLGVCAILSLGIMIERAITLTRVKQAEDKAFLALQSGISSGERGALEDPEIAGAPVSHIVRHLQRLKGATGDAVMEATDIALSIERLRLRRFLGTLATIGSTAPFIGLFGTVLGVMAAFQAMSKSGLSGETMAAGISEALSATAVGLLVAIPSVMAYNFFLGRVQGLMLQIQGHVARLTPQIEQQIRVGSER